MRRGRVAGMIAAALFAASVSAQSMYPEYDAGSTARPEVTRDIEALVQEFARRWTREEWRTVLDLWDRNEAAPYLLLSHQPDWLIGWDQLDGYFARKPTVPTKEIPAQAPAGMQQIELVHYEYRSEKELRAMLYTAKSIRVREIDDDLALAAWYVDFDYKPPFMPAKGESFKANAIFRNTPGGWKFIHYAEAPMSAIMYFERLYRKEASPEFLESLEKRRSQGQAEESAQ
ncbi:MAG: hypothetical protein JSV45_13945 [Chromatiales bacterium]|nr:MAG: hypothetical protein JSV45_13945 [Chromatiales bacterium]